MRAAGTLGRMVVATIGLWLLVIPPANAYVDPGSTTLVFAWIVGGVAAAAMTFKTSWRRVKGAVSRSGSQPDDGASGEGADDPGVT